MQPNKYFTPIQIESLRQRVEYYEMRLKKEDNDDLERKYREVVKDYFYALQVNRTLEVLNKSQ